MGLAGEWDGAIAMELHTSLFVVPCDVVMCACLCPQIRFLWTVSQTSGPWPLLVSSKASTNSIKCMWSCLSGM